jgi:hypothetical protein
MVTCFSCIASSSALCTLAGARLISSASTTLAKIGPRLTENVPVPWSKTCVPTTSAGSRSGVNWMRWKVVRMVSASVRTVSVLASPGTPSSSTCPPVSRPMSSRSTMYSCPTTRRATCRTTPCTSAASAGATCAGCVRVPSSRLGSVGAAAGRPSRAGPRRRPPVPAPAGGFAPAGLARGAGAPPARGGRARDAAPRERVQHARSAPLSGRVCPGAVAERTGRSAVRPGAPR